MSSLQLGEIHASSDTASLYRAAVDTMFGGVVNLTNRVGSVSGLGTNLSWP